MSRYLPLVGFFAFILGLTPQGLAVEGAKKSTRPMTIPVTVYHWNTPSGDNAIDGTLELGPVKAVLRIPTIASLATGIPVTLSSPDLKKLSQILQEPKNLGYLPKVDSSGFTVLHAIDLDTSQSVRIHLNWSGEYLGIEIPTLETVYPKWGPGLARKFSQIALYRELERVFPLPDLRINEEALFFPEGTNGPSWPVIYWGTNAEGLALFSRVTHPGESLTWDQAKAQDLILIANPDNLARVASEDWERELRKFRDSPSSAGLMSFRATGKEASRLGCNLLTRLKNERLLNN